MQISPLRIGAFVLLALGFVFPVSNAKAQVAAPAAADQEMDFRAPVDTDGSLCWKFREGSELNVNMVQSTNIVMNISGQEIVSRTEATNAMTLSVESVDADGVATVSNMITRMVVDTEGQGASIKFDSDEEAAPEGASAEFEKMLRPMIGHAMSQKMSPNGKVFDVTIPKEMLDGIKNANPMMGQMFSEKSLQEMATKGSMAFPEDINENLPQKVGTSWNAEEVMEMGPMKISTATEYVYKGVAELDQKPVHVIEGDVTMEFLEGALGADITITEQDATIMFYFDGNAGRLVKSVLQQNVDMEIKAGPQKIDQTLTQSMILTMAEGE